MSQDANNDLFGNTGEWEIVETPSSPGADSKEENETALPEPPVSGSAPQMWEDIPAEVNPAENNVPSGETFQAGDAIPAEEPLPPEETLPIEETAVSAEIAEPLPAPAGKEEKSTTGADIISSGENLSVPPQKMPAPGKLDAASEDAPQIHYRHTAPDGIASLDELGKFLARTRVSEGLSPEKVCDVTKIRPDYLEAIETGDVSELPQAVYVLAYIRKLCQLYSVDTANLDDFFNDLRDGFAYELPEDINKSIVGHENDEEQQKKLRQLALALISSAAIVLVAIIIGIVFLLVGVVRSGVFSSGSEIKDAEIIDMQGEPRLLFYAIPARRR